MFKNVKNHSYSLYYNLISVQLRKLNLRLLAIGGSCRLYYLQMGKWYWRICVFIIIKVYIGFIVFHHENMIFCWFIREFDLLFSIYYIMLCIPDITNYFDWPRRLFEEGGRRLKSIEGGLLEWNWKITKDWESSANDSKYESQDLNVLLIVNVAVQGKMSHSVNMELWILAYTRQNFWQNKTSHSSKTVPRYGFLTF